MPSTKGNKALFSHLSTICNRQFKSMTVHMMKTLLTETQTVCISLACKSHQTCEIVFMHIHPEQGYSSYSSYRVTIEEK